MRAIMQGLTDAKLERLYGSEEQCLAAWVKVRQDARMPCPRCGNPKSYVYGERVGCTRCDMRWSITSDTELPLTSWFRGMHLMTSTKQCVSAVELGRRLGVCPERDTGAAITMPQANTEAMNEHLAEISRCVSEGAYAVLIIDGAGWHVASHLVVPHNIGLLKLPPYAPELNPTENI